MIMKENRKKLTFLAAAVLLAVGAGATAAYLTNGKRISNEMGAAVNENKIIEDFDPPEKLTEGMNIYKKEITVKNTGTSGSYVRVFLDFSDSLIRDVSGISADGENFYSACHDGIAEDISESEDGIRIKKEAFTEHLPEGWHYVKSPWEDGAGENSGILGGYFYYDKVLLAGESTAPLTKSIVTYFKDSLQAADYEVIVTAQSLQDKGKNGLSFPENGALSPWETAWLEYLERR